MKIIIARHGESQADILHMISNRKLPHALTSKGMVIPGKGSTNALKCRF